jgi:molybdenum cofactor biosynthesis protein MoaC
VSSRYNRTIRGGSGLTHVDKDGEASMADVSFKDPTRRTATAEAVIQVGNVVYDLLTTNVSPGNKGNVFGVAQLAGIMAAKRTSELIPLCHSVELARVDVKLLLSKTAPNVLVSVTATTGLAQTGVEMEALTGASVAALTVYDMCKAASKDMIITDIRLVSKSGGKSGDYRAPGKLT